MEKQKWYLIFRLENQSFALTLNNIETTIQAVYITPMAGLPDYILGEINFRGRHIPVVNVRNLFNLKKKELSVNDHIIIINSKNRFIALLVDEAINVVKEREINNIREEEFYIDNQLISGLILLNDEIILLNDIDAFIRSNDFKLFDEKMLSVNTK